MSAGKFEKLKIIAYSDPGCEKQVGEPFSVMLNPENYSLETKMEFQAAQGQGTSATPAKFVVKPPEEMSFEILFDNTGIIDGKPRADLADELKAFKEFLMGYDGEIHRPKYLKFVWGKDLVKGVCSALNIAYKLFNPNGTPIRAICKVTIREMKEDERRVAEERRSSPDLTHYRTIKKGDTLPLMCYRIYGHSKYYLQVAQANGFSNFRNLQPGEEVFFPPIDKTVQ
jgi:phage tail protein X